MLFLIPDLSGGGAERVFVHLMNNIDRKVFEVHLCVFKNNGPYFSELTNDIVITNMQTRLRGSVPKIARCINRIDPDVVLCTIFFMNLAVGFARPLVRHRNCRYLARESSIPSERKKIFTKLSNKDILYRIAYQFFDYLICQSEDMLEDVHSLYRIPRARLIKINNQVDINLLRSKAKSSVGKWRIPGKVNLLSVGRLHPAKGYDLLIKALALASSRKLHIHILGTGLEEQRLKNMARELGVADCISFHGFQENPYPYMAQADGFVLTSRYEGLPNAMLEALALGCPAIAFKCKGGITEIVKGGKNGFLLDLGDVKSLAAMLDSYRYLDLDRGYIAGSVADKFDLKNIIRQYEQLFLR